jgi:hypothetical protein
MKWLLRFFAVALACASIVSPAAAGGDNQNAAILLHVSPIVTKNVCDFGKPSSCGSIVTSAPTGAYYNVYLIVANGSDSTGVAGAQYGIEYNGTPGAGVDIYSWTRCAALDVTDPSWPADGTGALAAWNASSTDPATGCQMLPAEDYGVTAVVGYFYVGVYSPDRMSVTVRPVDGKAKVANCQNVEDDLTGLLPPHLGYVDFGGGGGYNPCGVPVAFQTVTWGGIKALYR